MSRIQLLLDEYAASHQNETNKTVHWICVPFIFMSVLGLFQSIPAPNFFGNIALGFIPFSWAIIFVLLAFVYYLQLSFPLALGMLLLSFIFLWIINSISNLFGFPVWEVSIVIFILAWIGQFWGHKIEGKKPSFLKDLQFLLIGPAWLLHFIYAKIGIGY
jgi:uncharacterized membrane protein YGL010W